MREIKFRGKSLKTGKWLYGDLIQNKTFNKYAIVPQDNDWHDYPLFEVDIKTVGQFTGLKDKNGKDIYEGDKVRDKYGFVKEVRYYLPFGGFAAFSIAHNPERELHVQLDQQRHQFEVIGNIYEAEETK